MPAYPRNQTAQAGPDHGIPLYGAERVTTRMIAGEHKMAQQIVAHGCMKYPLVDWPGCLPGERDPGPDRSVDPPLSGCARWSFPQRSQSDMAAVKPALSPRGEAKCVRGPSARRASRPSRQYGLRCVSRITAFSVHRRSDISSGANQADTNGFHESRDTKHESRPFSRASTVGW